MARQTGLSQAERRTAWTTWCTRFSAICAGAKKLRCRVWARSPRTRRQSGVPAPRRQTPWLTLSNRTIGAGRIRGVAAGKEVEIDGLGRILPGRRAGLPLRTVRTPQVFIAYVREDLRAVERLCEALETAEFSPWTDARKLVPARTGRAPSRAPSRPRISSWPASRKTR